MSNLLRAAFPLTSILVLSVLTAPLSQALPTPAHSAKRVINTCTVRYDQPQRLSVVNGLKAKGYAVSIGHFDTVDAFKNTFQPGDYGFHTQPSMNGPETFLFWRLTEGHIGSPVVAYVPSRYFRAATAGDLPACSELRKLRTKMAYDYTLRVKTEQSKDAMFSPDKSSLVWGHFFIDAEATLMTGQNFDKRLVWETTAKARYAKILQEKESIAQIEDPLEQITWLRKKLFDNGIGKYCRSRALMSGLLSAKNPCGNCVANTLLTMSALHDLHVKAPTGYRFGVQVFIDHLRPVAYNTSTDTLIDLMSGESDARRETIYKPEFLFWGFQKTLANKNDPSAHWYLSSDQMRRNLILFQTVGKSLLSSFLPSVETVAKLKPSFLSGAAPFPYVTAYDFGPSVPFSKRFSETDPPETAVIQYHEIVKPPTVALPTLAEKMRAAAAALLARAKGSESKKASGAKTARLAPTGTSFESEGDDFLTLIKHNDNYFDRDEMNAFFADESDDVIGLAKAKFKVVQSEVTGAKEKTVLFGFYCNAHTDGLLDIENYDSPTFALRLVSFRSDEEYCEFFNIQNTYDRAKSTFGFMNNLANTVMNAPNASNVLSFLNTGRLDRLQAGTEGSADSAPSAPMVNLANLSFINKQCLRLPHGPSANAKYPLDFGDATHEIHDGSCVNRSSVGRLFPALLRFERRAFDHKAYFALISQATAAQKRALTLGLLDLAGYLDSMTSSILPSQLKSTLTRWSRSDQFLNREQALNLTNPLRKVLLSLLNDRETFYTPSLTEVESQQKKAAFNDVHTSILNEIARSDARREKSTAQSAPQAGPTPPMIFALRTVPVSDTSKAQPLWSRPQVASNTDAFRILLGTQSPTDRESAEFQFPVIMHWGDSLIVKTTKQRDETAVAINTNLLSYWLASSQVLLGPWLDASTIGVDSFEGAKKRFNPSSVATDLGLESLHYYFSPSFVQASTSLDARSESVTINQRERGYGAPLMPYRFHKLSAGIGKHALAICSSFSEQLFVGCELIPSPIRSMKVQQLERDLKDTTGAPDPYRMRPLNMIERKLWFGARHKYVGLQFSNTIIAIDAEGIAD